MKSADVIIFGGQSNMQGQSECLSECEAVERAREYKYISDTLAPLKNPVGEDIRFDGGAGYAYMGTPLTPAQKWREDCVVGSACYGHTNLVPAFCRAYVKEADTDVIAVHIAKGSTTIAQWLPGTKGYEMLVKKGSAAIQRARAEYAVKNVYFVWLQGESDAIEGNSKAYYKEKMHALGEALRRDVGILRFGVIRVGRFVNDARDFEIIDAQDEICREDPFFFMLTDIATKLNTEPVYMNPHVGGHFSAAGLEKLGSVAGAALASARE